MGWLGLGDEISTIYMNSLDIQSTYQQTLLLHQHTEVPCRVSIGLRLVNDNGIEQTLATDGLNHRAVDGLQAIAEDVAELLGPFDHLLLLDNFQSPDGHRTTQGVTAISRSVSTRFDGEHNILTAQNTRDGIHSTRNGLAQQHQIGLDAAPLVAEKLTSAGNTRLDLIADQESIVLIAQGSRLLQVVLIWDDDAGLTLDGLNQEGRQVGACLLKGLPQSGLVVVCDGLISAGDVATDAGEVRTIVVTRLGVR